MSVMRFLAGFAVGAALGAVAGVLLAPKAGEETREIFERERKKSMQFLAFFGKNV